MKAPCRDCTERQLGCHSDCEKYINYRKWQDETNAKIRKEKDAVNDWATFRGNAHASHIKSHSAKDRWHK